jgi:hypothetical protein
MTDRVPPLMGLHPADRGDADPAPVGVGVARNPLRPVDEHQPGASFGPDEPPVAGRSGGISAISGAKNSMSVASPAKEPSHPVHLGNVAGTQLIELSREVRSGPGNMLVLTCPPLPRSAPQGGPPLALWRQ